MDVYPSTSFNKLLYYKLVALWVVFESMLGGIIHGLKLPISGLMVGSLSIFCIVLIAYYIPQKNAILKATLIVVSFKLMLSPHTPPTAYIAVFFQGLLGALLLKNRKQYAIACILFSMLVLIESALQGILILVIVYGNNFIQAINMGMSKLFNSTKQYSLYIAEVYILIHIVIGLIVGWIATQIPKRLNRLKMDNKYIINNSLDSTKNVSPSKKKWTITNVSIFSIWILLFVLYIQSEYKIGKPILPTHISLYILIRSILIVVLWYFVLAPLAIKILKRYVMTREHKWKKDVEIVFTVLPSIKNILHKSWAMSGTSKGWKRWRLYSKIILMNIFYSNE